MCTLIILRRPGHVWPLLLAGNRDEMAARQSLAPARHWEDRPEVVGGLDLEAGGSWLGVNDQGLVATVLDRQGTLGREHGKRSRGELVLEALDHVEAVEAARALAELHPGAYRPFNLVVADPAQAFWIRHDGHADIRVQVIEAGLHMLGSSELDDPAHPRIAAYLPRFRAAAEPNPEEGDWRDWQTLLGERGALEASGDRSGMRLECADGFRTRSSALIAVPAYPGFPHRPIWLHADRDAEDETFRPVL